MLVAEAQAADFEQRRQVPQHWGQFVDIAQRIQGEESYGDVRRASQIIRMGRRLDEADLDKHRYYGIGLVICEFAKVVYPLLADESESELIIQTGAEAMLKAYDEQFDPRDLDLIESEDESTAKFKGLSLLDANVALEPIFDRAMLNLPPSVRVIGGCLEQSKEYRFQGANPNVVSTSDRLNAEAIVLGSSDNFLGEMRSNIFAGANALELLIEARHRAGDISSLLPEQADIDLLRDPSALRYLRGVSATTPRRTLNSSLVARNIKFTDASHSSLLPFDWASEAARRQKDIDGRPASQTDYYRYLMRDDPLVCPATKIPVVFPMITGLAIDMFDRARQLSVLPKAA